jgi:hypothetical protein
MSTFPTRRQRSAAIPIIALLAVGCAQPAVPDATAQEPAAHAGPDTRPFPVSGSAVHHFTTAAIHSEEPTPTGKVQRSTETIRLTGDLDGYILYHPTSTFDFAAGTLVNTGTQIFSGTVAGSAPVILHDDRFRFTVELATGATTGEVYLSRSRDAPERGTWFDCLLTVVGTGMTEAGDAMADYTGTCARMGNPR